METKQMWSGEAEQPTRPLRVMVAPSPEPQLPVKQQRPAAATQAAALPAGGVPLWAWVAAILAGTALALVTIPVWVPVLGGSIAATQPHVYWYLSRASAMVAFVLLWMSMASGLLISNKMARVWPGAFTAFDLHQFTSLLGLGFIFFHIITLLGDKYIGFDLVQLFVPFVDAPYRPLWVALGQIGLYLCILVTFTFYIRRQLGNHLWHVIHFASYGMFAFALLHGLFSGTDSGNVWVLAMYWTSAASLVVLTMYRISARKPAAARQ
jgi:predicted ferric reductase